jgi:hypothetical protein
MQSPRSRLLCMAMHYDRDTADLYCMVGSLDTHAFMRIKLNESDWGY